MKNLSDKSISRYNISIKNNDSAKHLKFVKLSTNKKMPVYYIY